MCVGEGSAAPGETVGPRPSPPATQPRPAAYLNVVVHRDGGQVADVVKGQVELRQGPQGTDAVQIGNPATRQPQHTQSTQRGAKIAEANQPAVVQLQLAQVRKHIANARQTLHRGVDHQFQRGGVLGTASSTLLQQKVQRDDVHFLKLTTDRRLQVGFRSKDRHPGGGCPSRRATATPSAPLRAPAFTYATGRPRKNFAC